MQSDCEGELELLTRYIRGVVTGPRAQLDLVDEKSVEVLRREPLHAWLLKIARSGCKIRGARGNSVKEVLALLEDARSQYGISKTELSRRSGVSRGHLAEMFGRIEPRPVMETIVRLAVGLGFPLEVVAQGADQVDDGGAPGTALTPSSPGAVAPAGTESGWRQAGAFGACMVGSALGSAVGGAKTSIGCGIAGAAAAGVGFLLENPKKREGILFVGVGVIAGTLVVGAVRLVNALAGQGGNNGT